jgi:peptide/nickel transport system substrate-binding protein
VLKILNRPSALLRSALALLLLIMIPAASKAEPQHAIAMHGAPKYKAGFTHFDYVNPEAPKGGKLALGVLGSFDSLNPLIIKGAPVQGIRE